MALSFGWPNETAVCGVYPFNITAGNPPFQSVSSRSLADSIFRPLNAQPIVTDMLEPPSGHWIGAYRDTQVQFSYGSHYAMLFSDEAGFGSGGVSPLQTVEGGPSSCMTNAHFNYTDKLFNFNVSGSTGECDGNFRVTWDGGAQQGPYNFSVIPLDGSYQSFIVPVDSSLQYYDWKVNMSAGTYFTVMFNNRVDWGAGGVGGLYRVTTGKNPGCATQVRASSLYTLPSDASVQSLPALQAIPTSGPSLSTGAIAGIAVGGAVALAGILGAVFFIARRSRVNRRSGAVLDGVVDLVSEEDPDGPVVEPFKSGGSLRKPNPGYGHHDGARASIGDDTLGFPIAVPYTSYTQLQPLTGPSTRSTTSLGLPSLPASSGGKAGLLPSFPSGSGSSLVSGSRASKSVEAGLLPTGSSHGEGSGRETPRGRIRRHEDAGPVEREGEGEDENEDRDIDLPPLYTDIRNRRGDNSH
ncbi:hypothetical protein EHS25_004257 [Saitozyma podzolica]|uniref:Uncharacterized protein n=1 Tax=Saitozyma podzolica TaxID=1890683 RepID=A0A427YTJ3_9TREE|nr:hypothetical protein EHS25_004257 [Saitozyma podzolica]